MRINEDFIDRIDSSDVSLSDVEVQEDDQVFIKQTDTAERMLKGYNCVLGFGIHYPNLDRAIEELQKPCKKLDSVLRHNYHVKDLSKFILVTTDPNCSWQSNFTDRMMTSLEDIGRDDFSKTILFGIKTNYRTYHQAIEFLFHLRLIVKKLFKTCWRNQAIFIFYKQQYWTSEGIKDDYIAELLIACEEIEKRQAADTALLKHIWPLHRLMADSAKEEFD